GASFEDILVPAFATVREASKRTLGQRHFDVQLIGGMVLHEGRIAEMKTGEGKTLVATLPVYLNALAGRGVHVVTVNDYLARRDAEWMGQIYGFLGLSVGVIVHGLIDEARTPLIISGPLDDRSEFYNTIDTFIPKLDKTDYEVDEKQRTVALSEVGMTRLEDMLRESDLLKSDALYDVENVSVVHHIN